MVREGRVLSALLWNAASLGHGTVTRITQQNKHLHATSGCQQSGCNLVQDTASACIATSLQN